MDVRMGGSSEDRRRSSLRVYLWVVAGTVAVLGVLWMAPAYACTPSAQVATAPPEADAGSTVQVGGTAFFPDAPVTIRWNSAEGPVLAEGSTDAAGAFDFAVTIPAVEPGSHAIIAVMENGDQVWPVPAAFEVLVPETPDPDTEPEPDTTTPDPNPVTAQACPDERASSSGFTDIIGNLHLDAIECTAYYGIAQGTSATTYSPSQGVRRDQMASFLTRTLSQAGVALPDVTTSGFTDIAGNRHAQAIAQLAELGIVRGTSDTTYSPGQGVRRDQMASFLVRTLEHIDGPLATGTAPFTDTAGNTHADAISAAYTAGLAQGSTATTYAPGQIVRRDQMASFLTRSLERLVDSGHTMQGPAS